VGDNVPESHEESSATSSPEEETQPDFDECIDVFDGFIGGLICDGDMLARLGSLSVENEVENQRVKLDLGSGTEQISAKIILIETELNKTKTEKVVDIPWMYMGGQINILCTEDNIKTTIDFTFRATEDGLEGQLTGRPKDATADNFIAAMNKLRDFYLISPPLKELDK